MPLQLVKADEVRATKEPDDQLSASEIVDTDTDAIAAEPDFTFQDFFKGPLSQIKRLIWGSRDGDWHTDITDPLGDGRDASLISLLETGGSTGVEVSALGQAAGNHSLPSFVNHARIVSISITTVATSWGLTLYEKDDYTTKPHIVVQSGLGNGSILVERNIVYKDQDLTQELHYNCDVVHDIVVNAVQLG